MKRAGEEGGPGLLGAGSSQKDGSWYGTTVFSQMRQTHEPLVLHWAGVGEEVEVSRGYFSQDFGKDRSFCLVRTGEVLGER